MPEIKKIHFQKLLEESVKPDADLEYLANCYLYDCETPEDIIERIHESEMDLFGIKTFSWISYKGKQILFFDTVLNSKVMQNKFIFTNITIYIIARLYQAFPIGKEVLTLMNLSGVDYDKNAKQATQKFKESIHHLNTKTAVYGLNPLHKMIVKAGARSKDSLFIADSKEDALEWLVS